MKMLLNIFAIIFAVIIQTTILTKLDFFWVYPNLILIVMLSLVFIGKNEEGLWWSGLGGVLLDIFSNQFFGLYTISLIIIFIISYFLVKNVFSSPSIWISILFFFVSSLVINLIYLILTRYYLQYLLEAIYNSVVGCIIYALMKYYYTPKEEVRI